MSPVETTKKGNEDAKKGKEDTECPKENLQKRSAKGAPKKEPKRSKGEASSSPRGRYDLDTDTLECYICAEPFIPPVYQCENGHTACAPCCQKLTKGCPSCSQTIGRIRCLGIEKVIESLLVVCKHAQLGCKAMVKYIERNDHENILCEYRPFECPLRSLSVAPSASIDCTYQGPKYTMAMHLTERHGVQTVECDGPFRFGKLITESAGGNALFKENEAWLFVSWVGDEQGFGFHCKSFWAPKEVPYTLKVKPVQLHRKSVKEYSMKDVTRIDHNFSEDFLVVPGKWDTFDISISLFTL